MKIRALLCQESAFSPLITVAREIHVKLAHRIALQDVFDSGGPHESDSSVLDRCPLLVHRQHTTCRVLEEEGVSEQPTTHDPLQNTCCASLGSLGVFAATR